MTETQHLQAISAWRELFRFNFISAYYPQTDSGDVFEMCHHAWVEYTYNTSWHCIRVGVWTPITNTSILYSNVFTQVGRDLTPQDQKREVYAVSPLAWS